MLGMLHYIQTIKKNIKGLPRHINKVYFNIYISKEETKIYFEHSRFPHLKCKLH